MAGDCVWPGAVLAWPDSAATLGAAQPPGGAAWPGNPQPGRSLQAVRVPLVVSARLHPGQPSRGPRVDRSPGGGPGVVRTRSMEEDLRLAHHIVSRPVARQSLSRCGRAATQAASFACRTWPARRADLQPDRLYESQSPASNRGLQLDGYAYQGV